MAKKKNTLKPVGTYAQNMDKRLQTLKTGNGTVGSYQQRINSLNSFMAKARDEERRRQAEAEQQQRALEKSRQETENMKKLSQDLTYGYGGRYDSSLAYQAKMMGLKAKDVQEEVNKSEKLYQELEKTKKAYNAQKDMGYAGVQKDRQIYGTDNQLSLDQWFRVKGKERDNQANGLYDSGDDPFLMTPEGRAEYRKKAEFNANNLRNRAKRYTDYNEDDALAGLFDRMYERDIANEQAIIDNPAYKGTDYERNALARKATLESERNEARRQAAENARRMRDSGINLQADEAHMPQLRKEVYDWVMTDGYDQRTKNNKADIDAAIDEYISGLRTPWGDYDTQADAINAANSMAAAYDSKVHAADEAQKYYDWKNKWTALAADDSYYNAANEYVPENAPQVKMMFDETADDFVPEVQGDEVAKAYWYANNWQKTAAAKGKLDDVNKYMFIASDPDILRTFNEMYNKDMENGYRGERGSNLAEQFLKGLDPYLSTMMVEYQKDYARSKAEDPVAGVAGRIMSPALQVVGGIAGTLGAITGAKKDSPLYTTSRVVSELRSQQNENVGEWADRVFGDGSGDIAKFMLGVVDSIADNVFAMGTGTALAGKGTEGAMRLVQLIMSGSATSNKMIENLDKGMDGTEAALSAVGSGIIEWLTERYSLERIMGPDIRQLYGNKRAMASFLARSAGAEGSEEIASGILETGLDSILSMVYGHADEITQRYNELITSDPNMTHQEATRIAMEEKLAEIGMEGLAGAMSGLGMAGSRVITTALENRAEGRNIQEKENGSSRVIDLAKQMGEGTESRALAEQLEKAAAEGKTIKNGDLGRLANLTALDVGEERSNAIKETINRKVTQQLTDKGISESDAAVYAQIIEKSIFDGGRLTAQERKTLAQNEEAIKLFASYNTFSKETLDLRKEINKETAPLDSIADQIGELAGKPEAEQESAAAAAVQESMKAADSMEEAIDNLQAKNSGLLSEGFAKLVKDELASNPVLKKSRTYLDDIMKIRLAAMTGDSMPRTALNNDVAQRFFDAAKAEFDEVDADRVVPQAPAQEGQGKATFNGAEYGTDAWKQETQGLSKWTRNVMGAVGEIAARFGYRVNLVNDPENKDVYGFEDANTGAITINVANGFKHHMLVTMAHEMTHWLEQNSRGGYNDLRSFVLESLRKEGVNVQERIVKIMDNYNMVMKPEAGKGMTINQAMAELVAQSSEGLLSSRRAAMELQSINPNLYGRVQNYVKNMIARLDAAIHSMEYEASMSQEAKALRNYREQLADIWFNGRKDAQGQQGPIVTPEAQQAEEQTEVRNEEMETALDKYLQESTEEEQAKPQNVQYSVAQRDEAYQAAVDSGNVEEQQKIVDEAAEAAMPESKIRTENGQLRRVYHGTYSDEFTVFDKNLIGSAREGDTGFFGKGFYFTINKGEAQMYGSNVKEAYLNIKNPFDFRKELNTYNGERSFDYNGGRAAFIVNWANKFPVDSTDETVAVSKDGDDHISSISLKEFADEFENVYNNKEFKVEPVERDGRQEWLVLADPKEETYTDAKGKEHKYKYYDFQKYFYTEEDARNKINQTTEYLESVVYDYLKLPASAAIVMSSNLTDILKSRGYDGAIQSEEGDEIVAFESEQIKSADPVTYDDDGNVIPPSQRFNEQQKDIRFSLANAVEERQDGLIAVHNLTEKNLIDTLKEGGFTAPSIAVIKAKTGHSMFGAISVIFSKDTIDPQRDRGNKIYGADAWTPTRANAQIETKIDYDKMMEAKKKVNQIMENADPYYAHEAERWIGEKAYHDDTNKTLDEWADQAAFNEGMLAAFMTAEGQEIKKEYRHILDDNELVNDEKHLNMYNSFLERMEKWGLLNSFMESMKNNSVEVNNVNWASHLAESSDDATIKKVAYDALSENPGMARRILSSWLRQIYKYEQAGREIKYHDELDRYKMRETMQNTVNRPRFNKWITNLFSAAFGERGVYNGTDPFYRNGERRSWKSMHWAPTAENIVRAMYTNHEAKGGEAGGATGLIAKASKEYKNIEQVRQDMGRLQLLDENDYKEKINQLDEELNDFISDVEDTTGQDFYTIKEALIDAAGQYAKSEKIDWFNYALNDNNIKLNDEQTAKAKELLEKARNIETGYFEAKPERVVGLDEIARVIVPEGTDQALIDALDNAGIEYDTYDGTDEDRLKKLNAVPNVQFSIAQSPDMEVNNFMMGLNEFNLPTYQEKTMLRQYKDARTRAELLRYGIRERENERKKLLAEETLSPKRQKRLGEINRFLERDRAKLDSLEKELVRVTGTNGYARMMMNQENIMKNLTSGQSAADLEETVNNIQENLDNVTREMDERAEELKKLASAEAVVRIRQQFDSRGLKKIAAKLKADMNSELENKEIENRLALIALKMKQGKYDAENAEELADLLAGRMKAEYDGYVISELRGSTITLGPVQMKELKGTGRTLNDIRDELAGTGIRIGTKGSTTLDEKWQELCKVMPSLDPTTSAGNQLDELLKLIKDEKAQRATVYSDENLMKINQQILEAAQQLIPEIITDENSLKLIRESMALVARISGAAKSSAEAMTDINAMIDKLVQKGKRAVVQAKKITGDIESTIEYFDQLSLQSEAAMWKQERIRLIEQMKSDNTKALMEEADRWRERIEKDKAFREAVGENLMIRQKLTTKASRIRSLLINETDLKNIPEHMKGLARELMGKIVDNDLAGRKLTNIGKQDLIETARVLAAMKELDGDYNPEDLRQIADEEAQAVIADALADLEEGLEEYNGRRRGEKNTSVKQVHDQLQKILDAVTTITSVINAERYVSLLNKNITVSKAADDVRKDFQNTRFRGELAGRGSKAVNTVKRTVVYGNMTPEYYIENLRNRGMTELWQDMKRGENRNGLEARKAQDHMAQLAAETNYKAWANEKHDVTLGGMKRTLTIGNMMELYAIWQREHTSNPEMSQHLNKGGVFFQDDSQQTGKLRHEQNQQRAIRVTDEEIQAMYNSMTAEQKQLIDGVVKYLSNDMSDLGNEASMRMYGIKKYKETYYFPMKVWDGVKSARSDKGITGTDENRAAHKSWSKRRQHMARNALVIGDFMTDAVNHIVEMINYNTMAPSIENINKVLNYKFTEEAGTDNETQRNLRVMFRENYGLESLKYLEDLLKDLNGGPAQDQRKTLRDRLLSVFKKNAVAGSMSVALQQPLSYIRAAMMINPKYLAEGLGKFWKGSYEEMITHSGVAVIKDMGRFDMNFGQSAKDYITPETKLNLYEKASDVLTKAPELMDRMTWTRMWAAVKAEQAAKNPGMDTRSEVFMDKVTERFNELMRKTQVYDSILVKSSNMRSQNLGMKVITSFMAEPTLTLNVVADAIRNAGAEGGKKKLAKALATFLISAVMQSAVKALMGSGRSPDKKKTWAENFLNKLQQNLMNEANPVSLVPGYGDIIEVLKTGELRDDAMSAIGKLFNIVDTTRKAMEGKGKGGYRDVEDTVGQFTQLFTNIPMKNLMRDARAVYNWIVGSEYADRATSGAVLNYQRKENWFNGDNMLGVLNTWMGEAGFTTSNASYYSRIYQATKNGNTAEANALKEYMTMAKGTSDEAMKNGLKAAAKKDTGMTEAERSSWMIENGLMNNTNTVTTQYKEGKITREEAKKLYREVDPEITDDDLWWKIDRMDWQKETGAESVSGYNYRLKDAIQNNKAEEIRKVVESLMTHGRTQKQIKDALSDWKSVYLEADSRTKTAIRDAIQKAYKAMGLTAADADKVINGWKKNNKTKQTSTGKDTTGRYGKGNIDLNNRKVVHNSDGTISTEESITVTIDGKYWVIPTIINGKRVNDDEAINYAIKNNKYLGKFNTLKEADKYAEEVHNRQDWYYNNK